jgi:hypothetical protein
MSDGRRAFLSLCLVVGLLYGVPSIATAQDSDNDGISDDQEMTLARRFFPIVHFSGDESCPGPLPRKVLFRAHHPTYQGTLHQEYIAIEYVHLYSRDCGIYPVPFFNGHDGDNESFVVWLEYDGTLGDWTYRWVAATAHWGTSCETQSSSYGTEVWVAADKHSMYTYVCNGDCWLSTWCNSQGTNFTFDFYNAGEPYAPMIDALEVVDPSFLGEQVWSDPDGSFFDGGNIPEQLRISRYAVLTPPPEIASCYSDCNTEFYTCRDMCFPDYECTQQCYADRDSCLNWCDYSVRWDQS